jgi:hypothetical protein
VGIGYWTCQWVLTKELGMHHASTKFVPSILTGDQKQQRFDIRTELRQLPSPPHSPGLAPCDFLFPKMKLKLKGRRFDTSE